MVAQRQKGVSQRAYARHRKELGLAGGTLNAVQQAIESGRLKGSLVAGPRGAKQIANFEAADREWEASTLSNRIPQTGPTAPGGAAAQPPPDLAESRARREAAEAALAEIELAERRRELVPAKDVESRLVNVFTHCKTKLLAVPSRAREQDPTLTAEQIRLFEKLQREALEDLAAAGGGK